MRPPFKFALLATLSYLALTAHAQSMEDLGNVTGKPDETIQPHAISADGTTIVGVSEAEDGTGQRAFRWTSAGMKDLGALTPSPSPDTFSQAYAVSADGSVVVGFSTYDSSSRGSHAFRWTSAGGMEDLGDFSSDNTANSQALAVTPDGNVIVGSATGSTGNESNDQAFRWTRDGGMENLGALGTSSGDFQYKESRALALSADGNVVVGSSTHAQGFLQHAFIWTRDGGMEDLGDFTANQDGGSRASAVSADGSVVVGSAQHAAVQREGWEETFNHAFRWTRAGGMQDLGDFTANQNGNSGSNAISTDGSTIVGYADYEVLLDGNAKSHAFRWTEAGMERLGDLTANQDGSSSASAVSADGSVVVGSAEYDSAADSTNFHAYRWTDADGMQDLGDLTSDQQGHSEAVAVSADGRVVTGFATNDEGYTRAFIFKDSEPQPDPGPSPDPEPGPNPDPGPQPPKIQDYENLLKSLPKVGMDKELAAHQQQLGMQHLLNQSCAAGQAGQRCFIASGTFDTAGADGQAGRRQSTQGIVTLGGGLSEQWTAGASLSWTNSNLRHSAVNPKNGYGLSGWVKYSQSGLSGLGWQMNAALGYAKQNATITRGHGLKNVHLVHGRSDLDTTAAHVALGFGMAQPNDWTVTPQVSLTQQHSKFGAYSESPAAFTAAYDQASLKSTVLGLELNAQKTMSNQAKLRFAVGVEQDLSIDRMKLSGTSDVPGAQRFDLESPLSRQKLRPYVAAGYSYPVSPQASVFVDLGVVRGAFVDKPNVGLKVGYSARF